MASQCAMNLASVTGNAVQRSRLSDRDRRTETEQVIKQAVAFVVAEDSGGNVVNFTPVVFRDQRSPLTSSAPPYWAEMLFWLTLKDSRCISS